MWTTNNNDHERADQLAITTFLKLKINLQMKETHVKVYNIKELREEIRVFRVEQGSPYTVIFSFRAGNLI